MRHFLRALLLVACLVIAGCLESRDASPEQAEADAGTAAGGDGSEPCQEAFEALKGYCGRDLQKLGEEEAKRLLGTITKLVPEREYHDLFDFAPWRLWRFTKPGAEPYYLLLEANTWLPHPGSTAVRCTLFDDAGRLVSETAFKTGHRCYLRAAQLKPLVEGEHPILVLETGLGAGPGPDISRQYYAKVGSRFDLIRLEDSEGAATRNRYYVRHFACGPAVPTQSAAGREADLLSANRLRVLRSLVWLGGVHRDLEAGAAADVQKEDAAEARLAAQVFERPEVRARLQTLQACGDQWEREAAQLASKPERDDF